MRWLKRSLLLLAILLALAAAGFVAWGSTPARPMPAALAALESDTQVKVSTSPWLVFRPTGKQPVAGLIFYPGGRVDPRAYAPAAHAIAAQGYLVVIPPMTLNLAVLSPGRATEVIQSFPGIRHWALGGHSLGGAMAANYAYLHPDVVQGLVLWAAYPSPNNSLAGRTLRVVSVYATRDGLATSDKIALSRALLPADTRWVAVAGGNHAQFGWYGPQAGDNPATVDRAAQQQQAEAATVQLLASLTG